nr:hypothetical protein [Tanacetum cinerariifolium]
NVRNHNGLIFVPRITNKNGNRNGNVVAARIKGNGNGNNVNRMSMDPSRGELEQHPDTIEEIRAFYELYNNLVIEVEKVNTVNCETKEANVKLTAELASYRGREKISKPILIHDDEFLDDTPSKSVAQKFLIEKRLITANYDECVLNYVNGMNSYDKIQNANVSNNENQKKQKANVKRSKKLGSKEILASPRPSKPRTCVRWLPTGRIFDLRGKIIESSESKNENDTSACDNASTSNP